MSGRVVPIRPQYELVEDVLRAYEQNENVVTVDRERALLNARIVARFLWENGWRKEQGA